MSRAGGYYRMAFQGSHGVTQGHPLSPKIFNMVVDVVARHWVTVMVEGAEERGKSGQEGRHQASIFYAYDGMVASLNPRWIQGAFSNLVGLFDRVGLRNNVGMTVDIVCLPCQATGTQLEAAYGRQITGEGPTYREQHKGWVQCRECGEEMAAGSLAGHKMTQHGRASEARWSWKTLAMGEEPRTYRMEFLAKGVIWICPVEGCLGSAMTRTAMRVHFLHWHVLETVVILEEGTPPPTHSAPDATFWSPSVH